MSDPIIVPDILDAAMSPPLMTQPLPPPPMQAPMPQPQQQSVPQQAPYQDPPAPHTPLVHPALSAAQVAQMAAAAQVAAPESGEMSIFGVSSTVVICVALIVILIITLCYNMFWNEAKTKKVIGGKNKRLPAAEKKGKDASLPSVSAPEPVSVSAPSPSSSPSSATVEEVEDDSVFASMTRGAVVSAPIEADDDSEQHRGDVLAQELFEANQEEEGDAADDEL